MPFVFLLACLSARLHAGQGADIYTAASRRAGFLSVEEIMLHPSASLFAASGNSTKKVGASLASVLSSLEQELQYELHLGTQGEAEEPKNKMLLAFIVGSHLGICGVDRCFFGQLGLGLAKFLTCGGCCCWNIIDTIAIIINIAMFSSSMDSLSMTAEFRPSSVHAAFWVWLVMWTTQNILFYRNSGVSETQAFARRKLGDEGVGPPTKREIKALFQRFDKDGNGSLDSAELDNALRYIGVPEHRLAVYNNRIDSDHTGKVNIQEFANGMGINESIKSAATSPRSRATTMGSQG